MAPTIVIDGSRGSGGGQILRTALALSALTGRAFAIRQIRARRPQPGLAPQHLHAVRAFREVCAADCAGDREGSMELEFAPGGTARAGAYSVRIPTAGSVTLVLQALVLPLAMAPGDSEVSLEGGTHVPWSPPFNYLESCWLPFMSRLGARLELKLERAGFYPRGGGQVRARIGAGSRMVSLQLLERGALQGVEIVSLSAGLPGHVRQRQASRARAAVLAAEIPPTVQLIQMEALSPGSAVAITGVFEHTRTTASALGARGKSAERVGEEAGDAFSEYLNRPGAVDPYLADQLLLPLALAAGPSHYTTTRVSEHLLTEAEIIPMFLERRIEIEGEVGSPGQVRII